MYCIENACAYSPYTAAGASPPAARLHDMEQQAHYVLVLQVFTETSESRSDVNSHAIPMLC